MKDREREGVKERKRKEKVYTDIQRERERESKRVRESQRESVCFDTVHVHTDERACGAVICSGRAAIAGRGACRDGKHFRKAYLPYCKEEPCEVVRLT